MEKGFSATSILFLFALSSVAASVAGCANHGPWKNDMNASSAEKAAQNASLRGAPSPGISGNWMCDDAKCAPGTLKIIPASQASLETVYTERLPESSPDSVCRVHSIAQLTITEDSDPQAISGELVPGPIELLKSSQNTHDCQDAVSAINQLPLAGTSEVSLDLGKNPDEMAINGVNFKRVSDQRLASIQQEADIQDATISGNWLCIDPGFETLDVTISGDRRQLITDSSIDIPGSGQKCHVREVSALTITDETDPEKLYATRTPGVLTLVQDPANTSDCASVIEDANATRQDDTGQTQAITIQRDGNQELILLGHRFVRTES